MMKSMPVNDLVVPVRKWTRRGGALVLDDTVSLASMFPSDALPLGQMRDALKAMGIGALLRMGAPEATVFLRRDRALGAEAYHMSIDGAGISIVSSTDAGAYYAVQTLIDLVRLGGRELPCGEIEDAPTFKRRGVYYDCASGKLPTRETARRLIEWLAHWKINELLFYIEDSFTFTKNPDIGRGYTRYTPEDILAIQAHAKRHHVNFVPSLASFGHFQRILALPAYARLGELPGSRGIPGGTTLCPGDPASIKLVGDLYSEFLPLFEAEDFCCCLDEPFDLVCGEGRSKSRIKRVGFNRVYVDFLMQIRDLCHKHGKRMNMWGDIVMKHPEMYACLPKDICIMNWDYGPENGCARRNHELHDAGLAFVGCPGTNNWATNGCRLHIGMENISVFATDARENRAEGLVVADWGSLCHRTYLAVSLCNFAHAAAHAWCNEKVDDTRHIRRFTDLVFGDPKGALASALSRLGESPIGISQPQYNAVHEQLAHAGKPVLRDARIIRAHGYREENILASMDRVAQAHTRAEVAKRAEVVRGIRWPKPTRKLSPFETIAMDEFAAAAHMEGVGCDRINLARALRAGGPVKAADLRKHADDLERGADDLNHLWRLRNRPSHLRDNLALLRAGAREARALAAKH